MEELALDDSYQSEAFRLRKFIGACLIWILAQYETKFDQALIEPPPGVSSQLEVVKELYGLSDSHPDVLWWMLTQLDYHLNADSGIEQAIGERLIKSSFTAVRPMFIRQKIQRLLHYGRINDLPEQLKKYTTACLSVSSIIAQLPSGIAPSPTIDLSKGILADDAVVGLPLFVTALLRLGGSDEGVMFTFVAWREYCNAHSGWENLTSWMNAAQHTLTLDASTCERLVFDSAADLWAERVPAAINLARKENLSAGQLLVPQLAIVQFLNLVPWLDDTGPAVAELFASEWQRQLRFRGQFSMPNLTIPGLKKACSLSNRHGLVKVSYVINAASRALNRGMTTSLQELVDQLALRRRRGK